MAKLFYGLLVLSSGLVLTAEASWKDIWTNHGPLPNDDGPTARIKNGSVVGVHSRAYNQDFFLGVPYAQLPLRELRFTNPQSLNSSFAGPLSAKEYSADCVGYGDNVPLSEDCLYLNVIRPSNHGSQPLPVAVWIYGGGLRGGGTADSFRRLFAISEKPADKTE